MVLNKYITIEYVDRKVIVGYLCAENDIDAHNQMVNTEGDPAGELLVFPANKANQVIIDINKMIRKARV